MIRVAFASDDLETVNLHFGAAEQLVLYDVRPGEADLVGFGRFVKARMKGVNAERKPDAPPPPVDEEKMSEDKVVGKIEFLRSCAGVYAAKIGTSSIKRLIQADIQPIVVGAGFPIRELLHEVSLALSCGGLSWVDRAKAHPKPLDLPSEMVATTSGEFNVHELYTSADDIP